MWSFQARYDASELITQREVVSGKVRVDLTQRAESFGIVLDDISLTHLNFGREFTEAVEAKQVAQQEAERAKFLVEKVCAQISSQICAQTICLKVFGIF